VKYCANSSSNKLIDKKRHENMYIRTSSYNKERFFDWEKFQTDKNVGKEIVT